MLPKKGRREITINGVLYHYVINGCVSIVIRNSVTGTTTKWNKEYKQKWKMQLKPSDIKKIILDNQPTS